MSLTGKIALVTGATQGIGKETVLGLARQGAHVVIVGRDPKRTQEVTNEVKALSNNTAIESFVADLSLQRDVRKLSANIKSRFPRLDILVNNAGGIFSERKLTEEGFERTWALNHLSYFLLTSELLELLKRSDRARVVNVSSDAHDGAKLDFTNVQGEKSFGSLRAYGASKLANVLFTFALARRLEGTGVTANCLHPGVVGSGFGQNEGGPVKWFFKIAKPFILSPAQGAKTSLYLASSNKVEGVTGKYFYKCRPVRPSSRSLDVELQERLWNLSVEQTAQN